MKKFVFASLVVLALASDSSAACGSRAAARASRPHPVRDFFSKVFSARPGVVFPHATVATTATGAACAGTSCPAPAVKTPEVKKPEAKK